MIRKLFNLLAVLALVGLAWYLLWGAWLRYRVRYHGVKVEGVVERIYGDEASRTSELWIDYPDPQGQKLWIHYRVGSRIREGTKLDVFYCPDRPDFTLDEDQMQQGHQDWILLFMGVYVLGWAVYKLVKRP